MKLRHIIAVLTLIIIGITSCKKSSSSTTTTSSTTTLTKFYVINDSVVDGLDEYTFTIDNDANTIYNEDSLPYLCRVDSLIPTIYGSTIKTITINDTIVYTGNDTIDFSRPVTIKTLATDGESTRTYIVTVNVHQVDPDEYGWAGIKSEIFSGITATSQKTLWHNGQLNHFVATDSETLLFTSKNGIDWTQQTVTGLPATTNVSGIVTLGDTLFTAIDGTLYAAATPTTWTAQGAATGITQLAFAMNNRLFALGEADGARCMFVRDTAWTNLGTLPEQFPVSDFAVCVDAEPSGKMRAYLIGGKTSDGTPLGTVWSSNDGAYWANLAASKQWFTPRYGAAVVQYADGLMLFGGADANGECSDRQLFSVDYGLTWATPNDKALLPNLWVSRHNLNVVKDDENRLYIVGGTAGTTTLSDVWSGQKNSEKAGFSN